MFKISYSLVKETEMQDLTEQHEIHSKPSKIDTMFGGKQVSFHESVLEAPCVICEANEDEANSLLCDSCDMCMHSYCISLACIPDGQWVCPWCARSQAVDTPEVLQLLSKILVYLILLHNLMYYDVCLYVKG